MKQGQWITHNSGAAKIGACAQVYFQSCIDRIPLPSPPELQYQPWMAAPELVEKVFQSAKPIEDYCTADIMSVSPTLNENMNDFLRFLSIRDQNLKDIRVFSEISDPKYQKVKNIYAESIKLTECWSPWMRFVFKRVVKSIFPIASLSGRKDGFSFTDHNFIGAIFSSVDSRTPFPELLLNTFLAHELGHNVLMIYQHAGNFFHDSDEWVYSGVRKTLRPVVASFHAAVALVYLVDCTAALLKSRSDVTEKAYLSSLLNEYRDGLQKGLEALYHVKKSELCHLIYDDLSSYLS